MKLKYLASLKEIAYENIKDKHKMNSKNSSQIIVDAKFEKFYEKYSKRMDIEIAKSLLKKQAEESLVLANKLKEDKKEVDSLDFEYNKLIVKEPDNSKFKL